MSDAQPYNLIPSFITGGGASVFVAGVSQVSKQSEQNFSAELEYICVSRDTRYKRTYKVLVNFIKVEKTEAIIKSFSFGMHLNAGLAGDAVGTIDNTTNTINIKVTHTTPTVPKELVPEFASTGLVSVGGILQSSGSSSHSFRYDVYYKVTSIDDATVTRTYRVHVTFNYATESRCELFRFYFTQADNSTLREDIECYIGSASYNISGLLPNGADLASLKPKFEAYGVVKVNDVEQSSGVSVQDFTQVVEYVVISEDGQYSKRYKVKLQVAGEIIYLSADAHGANNGTSWQDAFTTLEAAIDVANKMTAPPEIWATCDNYADKTIRINKAIILRGGFNGTESSKDEREKEGGKLKRRLQLTNVTIERYFTKTSRWELEFGDMVFDGLNIIRDDQELDDQELNKGFLVYDKSMHSSFYRYTSSRSYTFEDCIVKDSCILLSERIGNGIFIKNSTFNAGCKIGVSRRDAYSHILSVRKLDIVDSIIAGQLCLRVEHVKIIDSNIEGETIFSLYTLLFKKENATSFCKNMDVNISHNESAKVEIEEVKIDKCTVSYNNRYYIGDVVFKGVQAEQISLYGCLGSVKLEDSIVNNVNDSSIWGKGWTKNLEIMNCGKKDDSTQQCGSFYLRALNATIKDSWFQGDIDLSIEASPYESAITEVHTTVENLKAKGFRCGKREDVEEITDGNVSGRHMISNSKFTKLVCLGGDEINLEDVEFAKDGDVEIILLNSETPNSKIKLKKVKKEWWDNLTELSCVTNNLIVGEANEAKSGVVLKRIRRVKLNGKNSVDVRESELSCSSGVERDCLFVGSQEVTFTNNRLNDIWLNLDCESAFNIDGNDGEINLSLYYPKGYTFSNKTFSSLELRSESFFPAEFHAINNDDFYVNDCTFKNNFVNKRPHVTLSNPIFAGVFSYRSGQLQAYSYPLKVKNMKSFATMKIANLKDDETAKISLTDSDIKGPVNDYGYPLNIPYVIELGSKTSLDMENTKISKIVRLMEVQPNAQVTISKNCVFSSIGKLMIGLGATLKIENDSSDLASNPKFFIDNTIWSWNFSSYLNVGNLQMKKVIFEKDYSFTIHNKLEELIFARNATITDSDFKNIGDMCTICVESRICKIENCNFTNAGILYVLTSEPTFSIKGGKFENIELHLSMSKTDGSAVIFENVDFFYPDTRIMVLNKFGIPSVDYGPVAVKFEYDIASLPAEVQTRLGGVVNTARIKNFVKTKLLKESNTNRVGYFLNLGNESPSNTSSKKFYGNYH